MFTVMPIWLTLTAPIDFFLSEAHYQCYVDSCRLCLPRRAEKEA